MYYEQIDVFLTSALFWGEWPASRFYRFNPGTYWRGGWFGPRTSLDVVERRNILTLPGLELRPLCRPACSQSIPTELSRFRNGLTWKSYVCVQIKNNIISQGIRCKELKSLRPWRWRRTPRNCSRTTGGPWTMRLGNCALWLSFIDAPSIVAQTVNSFRFYSPATKLEFRSSH
jgi:hypothetical protein